MPFYGLITTNASYGTLFPSSFHARTFSGPISSSVMNLTHLVPFEESLKSTAWSSSFFCSVFVPPILKVVISPFPLFRRTKGPWIGFQQPAKSKRDRMRLESDLKEEGRELGEEVQNNEPLISPHSESDNRQSRCHPPSTIKSQDPCWRRELVKCGRLRHTIHAAKL